MVSFRRFTLAAFAVVLALGGAFALILGAAPGFGWGLLLIALALGSAATPRRIDA